MTTSFSWIKAHNLTLIQLNGEQRVRFYEDGMGHIKFDILIEQA